MEGSEIRGVVPGAGHPAARPPAPVPLKPARAAMSDVSAPAREASDRPAPEVLLEVDGVQWVVRELGCSRSSNVLLILVGFFHPEETGEARREAWVVARGLEQLTELQLEAVWRSSGPSVSLGARRLFFPEIANRGAKDG